MISTISAMDPYLEKSGKNSTNSINSINIMPTGIGIAGVPPAPPRNSSAAIPGIYQ
jgi:hypothetical protein